jgi:hypothetical protein
MTEASPRLRGPALHDESLKRAVVNLRLRAERQREDDRIVATYVDPGIGVAFENTNNQIVFGRRGTGKTHVLKVLQARAGKTEAHYGVYVDLQQLGSSATFADSMQATSVRVTSLLKDVLRLIHDDLLTHVTRTPELLGCDSTPSPVEALNGLGDVISASVLAEEREVREDELTRESSDSASLRATLSAAPSVVGQVGADQRTHNRARTMVEGRPLDRIDFPELNKALCDVRKALGLSRLFILLDEWAAIPRELQPLLAEFLRRSFFVNSWITVKIAAVEYHSRFYDAAGPAGIQPGTDVAAALHLDDYLVYDRAPDQVSALYRSILYKHLAVELGWDSFQSRVKQVLHPADRATPEAGGFLARMVSGLFTSRQAEQGSVVGNDSTSSPPADSPWLESFREILAQPGPVGDVYVDFWGKRVMKNELGVEDADGLAAVLFGGRTRGSSRAGPGTPAGGRDPFTELARAAEGVPRDFIQIFTVAFFEAFRKGAQRVNVPAVVAAASHWYFNEKASSVQGCAAAVLERIVADVLGSKKERRFLVPRNLEENPILRSLVDLRVVHLIERGYMDSKNPAITYSVYSLDYGAYVRLIGTTAEPTDAQPLAHALSSPVPVPSGNKTRLRSVIVSANQLRCPD